MEIQKIRFHLGELNCWVETLAPRHRISGSYNRHRHAFLEVHHVAQGTCGIRVGDRTYTAVAGEVLCIGAEQYHSIKTTSADLEKMSVGIALGLPPGASSQSEALYRQLSCFEAVQIADDTFERLFQMLRSAPEDACSSLMFCEEVQARMALFLLEVARRAAVLPGVQGWYEAAEKQYRQPIEEFFNRNFALRNGKDALARRLCISPRQLDRVLHALYDMSYREKLEEIRLEIAKDLLLTTSDGVEEIAEFLGYGNASNFTAFLKKKTGTTPRAMRKARRGDGI